eukprot:m.370204 g.370204  ORF g.370204 m.370204 type:complete len:155 (+) comp28126_c0_seq32:3380-3844(+)
MSSTILRVYDAGSRANLGYRQPLHAPLVYSTLYQKWLDPPGVGYTTGKTVDTADFLAQPINQPRQPFENHRSNLGDVDPRTDTGVSTSEHSRDEWPIWADLGSHSLRASPIDSVSVCLDVVAIAAMPASQIGLHVHAPASLTRGAFVEPAYEIS